MIMYLEKIEVTTFRNYSQILLELSKGLNIIYGNNAQGKTNLLESIYVLGLTKSHRSFIDQHLIKQDESFARVKGILNINDYRSTLELLIQKSGKKMKIDGMDVKKVDDYISNMNIIIFYPEDLKIVKDSPGERRKFLNTELSQLYSNYYHVLNEYNKLLKMRNDYLKKTLNSSFDDSYFDIITEYLIDKAILIYRMRNQFVNDLNQRCEEIYQRITGLSSFHIHYNTNIELGNTEEMKVQLRDKYKKLRDVERKIGSTMVGPHRDDLDFLLGELNLKSYGSQGQQRIAVLALKLGEIEIFKQYKGYYPILLLDDVFSELDEMKKNNLLFYIKEEIQTIITTTDLHLIDDKIIQKAKCFHIDHGTLIESKEV